MKKPNWSEMLAQQWSEAVNAIPAEEFRVAVGYLRETKTQRLARTRALRRAVTALVAEAKRQPDPLRWLAKQVIESQDPDWGP